MDPVLIRTLIAKLNEIQLQPGSTYEEVVDRWKTLAKFFHPDKNPGNASAKAEFQRIQSAYQFITTYKNLLPYLAVYSNPTPGASYTNAGQAPGAGTPPPSAPPPQTAAPSNPPSPQPPSKGLASARRHTFIVAGTILLLILTIVGVVSTRNGSPFDHAGAKTSAMGPKPKAPVATKPRKPPPPPRWEPVIDENGLPTAEIASVVGTSEEAVSAAFARAVYTRVDINVDGKDELLITRIDGTCRAEGCPVFLFWRKRLSPQAERAVLVDLLPNNYGWTSLTVVRHRTHGARDIIFTSSGFPDAAHQNRTSAERPCDKLVWSARRQSYVLAEDKPEAEECFEAEKHAWNIAADYHR